MKRLRILALSLALLLICLSPAVMPGAGAAKSYTACPYWIGVDIVNQRLTVYRTADIYGKKKGTVKIKVKTDNGKEATEKIKVK